VDKGGYVCSFLVSQAVKGGHKKKRGAQERQRTQKRNKLWGVWEAARFVLASCNRKATVKKGQRGGGRPEERKEATVQRGCIGQAWGKEERKKDVGGRTSCRINQKMRRNGAGEKTSISSRGSGDCRVGGKTPKRGGGTERRKKKQVTYHLRPGKGEGGGS